MIGVAFPDQGFPTLEPVQAGNFLAIANSINQVNGTVGPFNAFLPSATAYPYQFLNIGEVVGGAGPITVVPVVGEFVNGAPSFVMNTPRQSLWLFSTGFVWLIIATANSLGTAVGGVPTTILPDDVASGGVSPNAARSDHIHGIVTAVPVDISDSVNSEGASLDFSRGSHVHAHGARGGGVLHALATAVVAGFMSAADKTRLDAIIFGNDFQQVLAAGRTTTTLAAFQTKTQLITPALTGTYRVMASALIDGALTMQTRLQNVTDGVQIGGTGEETLALTTDRRSWVAAGSVVFAGVAKTFEIQWRDNPPAGQTAGITDGRIELWRVI